MLGIAGVLTAIAVTAITTKADSIVPAIDPFQVTADVTESAGPESERPGGVGACMQGLQGLTKGQQGTFGGSVEMTTLVVASSSCFANWN